MKRKGRKSKVLDNSSNGVSDRQDQNGEASERDEQDSEEPEDRRRKGNKRKSGAKKVDEDVEENSKEASEEPEEKRKKAIKRKSGSKKFDEDIEENAHESQGSNEPEDGRKKASKRKSSPKKRVESSDGSAHGGSEEPEEKRKKSGKRKSGASKKAEEEEEEPQYEVEQVLDEKMIQGVRHYLIRWKGYEPESDTWEPESTLNCSELIAEFRAKKKKKQVKSKTDNKRGKKRAGPNSSDQQSWDENQDFEVDRILDVYFKRNGQREFLVSWKGYPTSQNSWEPEENMDCKELIKKFMDKVEKAKESDQRELRIKRTHTDRLTLMSDGHRGRRLSKRNQGKQRVHYHDAE